LALQDFQKAQQCFEQDKDPNHYIKIEQYELKCSQKYQLLAAKDRYAQALKDQDKANMQNLRKAYHLFEDVRKEMITHYSETHFDVWRIRREQSDILFLLGQRSEALAQLNQSIERQKEIFDVNFKYKPPVAASFTLLGDMHMDMGNPQEAIEAYSKALEVNENIHKRPH